MTFFCYVANSVGNWTITLKRIALGERWVDVRLVIDIIVDGKQKFRQHTGTLTQGKIVEINKYFDFGPVTKKQPSIQIKAWNERPLSDHDYKEGFTISGKIYDLWKNGYTPEKSTKFIDVAFAWRNATTT